MNAKYLITAAALLCANIAIAQSIMPAHLDRPAQMRAMPVSNPVETITKEQARAAKMTLVVDNFDRIDTNGDGVVSRKELRDYLLANRRHVPMT